MHSVIMTSTETELAWLQTVAEALLRADYYKQIEDGELTRKDKAAEFHTFTGKIEVTGTRLQRELLYWDQELNTPRPLTLVLDFVTGTAYLSNNHNRVGVVLALQTATGQKAKKVN